MRGYAAIGLDNPKDPHNVGGIMRAAGVYDAALVVLGGQRFRRFKRSPADTMKAWKHMPVVEVGDVFDAIPHGCVPIAIDLIDGAVPLHTFKHPERAYYIFGAEDATLGHRITSRCAHVVYIPTRRCMNLCATVNVVLYDRCAKLGFPVSEPIPSGAMAA